MKNVSNLITVLFSITMMCSALSMANGNISCAEIINNSSEQCGERHALKVANDDIKETWKVKGKITVNHILPELIDGFGTSSPLANVTLRVKVRAKNVLGWGTWNSWGNITTNSKGEFSISKQKGTDRRQFKIELFFDNSKLRLKEGGTWSTNNKNDFPIEINAFDFTDKDYFLIYSDKDKNKERKAGTHQINVTVKSGRKQRLGDIWVLYSKILKLFDGYGNSYKFKKKIVAKYPMNIGGVSYANPANNHIYIANKWDSSKKFKGSTNTLIHELMHIWSYQHSKGEDAMTWQAAKHGSTHQDRESTTFVPFQEAFAEWSSYRVLRAITDKKLKKFDDNNSFKYPHRPLSRKYISENFSRSERKLANMDYSERGWHSLFNLLTTSDYLLENMDFNGSGKYAELTKNIVTSEGAKVYLKVFKVFLAHPKSNVSKALSKKEMNFYSFLKRAEKILDNVDDEKISLIKTCLNPNSTKNPGDFAKSNKKTKRVGKR